MALGQLGLPSAKLDVKDNTTPQPSFAFAQTPVITPAMKETSKKNAPNASQKKKTGTRNTPAPAANRSRVTRATSHAPSTNGDTPECALPPEATNPTSRRNLTVPESDSDLSELDEEDIEPPEKMENRSTRVPVPSKSIVTRARSLISSKKDDTERSAPPLETPKPRDRLNVLASKPVNGPSESEKEPIEPFKVYLNLGIMAESRAKKSGAMPKLSQTANEESVASIARRSRGQPKKSDTDASSTAPSPTASFASKAMIDAPSDEGSATLAPATSNLAKSVPRTRRNSKLLNDESESPDPLSLPNPLPNRTRGATKKMTPSMSDNDANGDEILTEREVLRKLRQRPLDSNSSRSSQSATHTISKFESALVKGEALAANESTPPSKDMHNTFLKKPLKSSSSRLYGAGARKKSKAMADPAEEDVEPEDEQMPSPTKEPQHFMNKLLGLTSPLGGTPLSKNSKSKAKKEVNVDMGHAKDLKSMTVPPSSKITRKKATHQPKSRAPASSMHRQNANTLIDGNSSRCGSRSPTATALVTHRDEEESMMEEPVSKPQKKKTVRKPTPLVQADPLPEATKSDISINKKAGEKNNNTKEEEQMPLMETLEESKLNSGLDLPPPKETRVPALRKSRCLSLQTQGNEGQQSLLDSDTMMTDDADLKSGEGPNLRALASITLEDAPPRLSESDRSILVERAQPEPNPDVPMLDVTIAEMETVVELKTSSTEPGLTPADKFVRRKASTPDLNTQPAKKPKVNNILLPQGLVVQPEIPNTDSTSIQEGLTALILDSVGASPHSVENGNTTTQLHFDKPSHRNEIFGPLLRTLHHSTASSGFVVGSGSSSQRDSSSPTSPSFFKEYSLPDSILNFERANSEVTKLNMQEDLVVQTSEQLTVDGEAARCPIASESSLQKPQCTTSPPLATVKEPSSLGEDWEMKDVDQRGEAPAVTSNEPPEESLSLLNTLQPRDKGNLEQSPPENPLGNVSLSSNSPDKEQNTSINGEQEIIQTKLQSEIAESPPSQFGFHNAELLTPHEARIRQPSTVDVNMDLQFLLSNSLPTNPVDADSEMTTATTPPDPACSTEKVRPSALTPTKSPVQVVDALKIQDEPSVTHDIAAQQSATEGIIMKSSSDTGSASMTGSSPSRTFTALKKRTVIKGSKLSATISEESQLETRLKLTKVPTSVASSSERPSNLSPEVAMSKVTASQVQNEMQQELARNPQSGASRVEPSTAVPNINLPSEGVGRIPSSDSENSEDSAAPPLDKEILSLAPLPELQATIDRFLTVYKTMQEYLPPDERYNVSNEEFLQILNEWQNTKYLPDLINEHLGITAAALETTEALKSYPLYCPEVEEKTKLIAWKKANRIARVMVSRALKSSKLGILKPFTGFCEQMVRSIHTELRNMDQVNLDDYAINGPMSWLHVQRLDLIFFDELRAEILRLCKELAVYSRAVQERNAAMFDNQMDFSATASSTSVPDTQPMEGVEISGGRPVGDATWGRALEVEMQNAKASAFEQMNVPKSIHRTPTQPQDSGNSQFQVRNPHQPASPQQYFAPAQGASMSPKEQVILDQPRRWIGGKIQNVEASKSPRMQAHSHGTVAFSDPPPGMSSVGNSQVSSPYHRPQHSRSPSAASVNSNCPNIPFQQPNSIQPSPRRAPPQGNAYPSAQILGAQPNDPLSLIQQIALMRSSPQQQMAQNSYLSQTSIRPTSPHVSRRPPSVLQSPSHASSPRQSLLRPPGFQYPSMQMPQGPQYLNMAQFPQQNINTQPTGFSQQYPYYPPRIGNPEGQFAQQMGMNTPRSQRSMQSNGGQQQFLQQQSPYHISPMQLGRQQLGLQQTPLENFSLGTMGQQEMNIQQSSPRDPSLRHSVLQKFAPGQGSPQHHNSPNASLQPMNLHQRSPQQPSPRPATPQQVVRSQHVSQQPDPRNTGYGSLNMLRAFQESPEKYIRNPQLINASMAALAQGNQGVQNGNASNMTYSQQPGGGNGGQEGILMNFQGSPELRNENMDDEEMEDE